MTFSHAKRRSESVKDMTQGNPYSQIIAFALPIFLSQVFQQLYNTADTLIVGRFLGTNALAAVSSSGTLIFLLVSFFNGTSMGAGVVVSSTSAQRTTIKFPVRYIQTSCFRSCAASC